ncbi:hypothetical protein BJ165DRAFT_347845 [Panaeolus papilionaceus]|nr:hypothetical protein BJ165DRAFT_347845 [Panaeolus papilionaceus]
MCPHIFFTLATSIILIYSQHLATTFTNSIVSQTFLQSRRETSDSLLGSSHRTSLPLTISQCQKVIKELQETLNMLKVYSDTLYGPFIFGDIRGLINLLDRQTRVLDVHLELLASQKSCFQHNTHYATPLSRERETRAFTHTRIRRHNSWPDLLPHSSSPSFSHTTSKTWHPPDFSTRQGSNSGRGGVIGGIHLNFHNGGNVNGMKYDYTEVDDYSKNTISRGHRS